VIKGRRVFAGIEEAKEYVLQRRGELHQEWEARMNELRGRAAAAGRRP
jgi:hypothetical protein